MGGTSTGRCLVRRGLVAAVASALLALVLAGPASAGADKAVLTIEPEGSGSGYIEEFAHLLFCTWNWDGKTGEGGDCTIELGPGGADKIGYPMGPVTIRARPGTGEANPRSVVDWAACPGTVSDDGTQCTVTIAGPGDDLTLRPRFELVRPLTVGKAGGGDGTVTSQPEGIQCGVDCNEEFVNGTTVTLTATPAPRSVFAGWSGGGCSGTGPCTVTMDQARSVTATFEPEAAGAPDAPGEGGAVEAEVITVAAGKSRLGARVVRAELRVEERVSVRLRLVRNGKTLASKRYAGVRPGDRVLTLVVPRRVAKGPATLRIELVDTQGNARSFRRSVRIGPAR